MTLVAAAASSGPWVDTAAPLSLLTVQALRKAGKLGVARYMPLPANAASRDISHAELALICGNELELLLVQHVRLPRWDPAKHSGTNDAIKAVTHAEAAGYPLGAHLFLDLEGINGSAQATASFADAWQHAVIAAGYRAGLYVGYAVPLHPADLYNLHGFDSYWSDAGPRQVATRGFALRQHQPEVTIGGVSFDPDTMAPDAMGGLPWSCRQVLDV